MEKYLVLNDYSQILEEFDTFEEAQEYVNENCPKREFWQIFEENEYFG